ncbi:unnamed protein product [Cyprideis torosa]|uniref:Uncharacterized protein n=1 Tax=Cyprideis torosa TaxID=163714 RepID=A0A7R8W0H1_9CRUS|nr:unnamed protein product [Cyprideis torosa]CAG0879736.1 unnamed protein product [Cyprideis torosa]
MGSFPACAVPVFNVVPSDRARSFAQVVSMQATSALATRDPIHALLILRRGVKGHLVLFPLEFLCDEGDLMPPLTLKEGLAPTCLWT